MKPKTLSKICTKCKIPKSLGEFSFDSRDKGYRKSRCKECLKKYDGQYREYNRKVIREKDRDRYQINKGTIKKRHELYYQNNKARFKKWASQYYRNHKNEIRIYQKANIVRRRTCENRWIKNRRKIDPVFRLKRNISSRISSALRSNKASWSWESLVRYTVIDLKLHLEKQFEPNMSWENYGEWHIDHRRPVSWFDNSERGLLNAWKLDNLQPMWAHENLIKGNRWESTNKSKTTTKQWRKEI